MGNSIDEIKMIADYICDTNDNDGVAKWLEENIMPAILGRQKKDWKENVRNGLG